jgi:Ala-tRNA(Pro) deacylase
MPTASARITDYLVRHQVPYQWIHHTPDFTSQETAAHTKTPGREFAKTVVLRVDHDFGLAVLPAPHRIDFEALRRWLNAQEVRLATEDEMESLFPDCEVGAEPPLGALYELPVYVSPSLARDEEITFNAGSHEDVIRMKYDDFARLTRPSIIHFSLQ